MRLMRVSLDTKLLAELSKHQAKCEVALMLVVAEERAVEAKRQGNINGIHEAEAGVKVAEAEVEVANLNVELEEREGERKGKRDRKSEPKRE